MAIYGGELRRADNPPKMRAYDYGQRYSDLSRLPDALQQRVKNNKLYKLRKYKARSLYKCTEVFGEERKNLPYDYTETLLSKMLSPYIYRNNTARQFLEFVNDWIVTLLQGVGELKIFKNFTVERGYKHNK